jgi:hypothetical protein
MLGGQCKVAWSRVTRWAELGGLGVIDLNTLGYALRMRWEWLAFVEPSQSWIALLAKPVRVVRAMFKVSMLVLIGDSR